MTETNWFFRLSRYREAITEIIDDAGGSVIEPEQRRNEVLGFLAGDVHDLSVSRPRPAPRAGASRSPATPTRSSTCGSTR